MQEEDKGKVKRALGALKLEGVSEVVGLQELRTDYKDFQERRKLRDGAWRGVAFLLWFVSIVLCFVLCGFRVCVLVGGDVCLCLCLCMPLPVVRRGPVDRSP